MILKNKRQELGQWGENIAANYYKKLGWQIIVRNYWTRYGELDLVCIQNNKILIIEVKTRTNQNFGWAEETIDDIKLEHIDFSYQVLKEDKMLSDDYELEICVIEKVSGKVKLRRFLI